MISIIIASYNKGTYVLETINSVNEQSFTNYELIIIDDASTDNTRLILEDYRNHPKIIVLYNDHTKGANYCRNLGAKIAKGSYLLFLDADDLLDKDCLKRRWELTLKHPDHHLFVTAMGVFHKHPGDDTRLWVPNSSSPLRDFLLHKLPWSIMQPLWNRDFFERVGGFDESFNRLQDVELHTRACSLPDIKIIQSPIVDCYYRIDVNRINFDQQVFLDRWVDAAHQYCVKFAKPTSNIKFLYGTWLHAYLPTLLALRQGKISKSQFELLQTKLNAIKRVLNCHPLVEILIRFYKFYNLRLPRIPGVNFLLTKLIVKLS